MGNSFELAATSKAGKPDKNSPEDPARREFFRRLAGSPSPEGTTAEAPAPAKESYPQKSEMQRQFESRRNFIELILKGSLVAGAGLFSEALKRSGLFADAALAIENARRELREQPLSERVLSAHQKAFEETYAIPLVYDENPHWTGRPEEEPTSSSEAWTHEKIQATKLLIHTCAEYPAWLIRDMKIPSITIRRDVHSGSLGSAAGRASPLDHRVLLNVGSNDADDPQILDESTIHHELFHVIDPFRNKENNETWIRMNRDRGQEYVGLSRKTLERLGDPPAEGFASAYGETNPKEDRATVYEKLWEDPRAVLDRKSPAALAGDDPLEAKGELMEQALFLRSKGMFTREFWYQNAYGPEETSETGWMEPFAPERYFKKMEKEILGSTYEQIKKSHPEFKNVTPQQFAEWQDFYLKQSAAK